MASQSTKGKSSKAKNPGDGEKVHASTDKHGAPATDPLAVEVANMHRLLKQMDSTHKKALEEIQQTTAAINEKLDGYSERLDNVEARLSLLEDATEEIRANHPPPMSELVALQDLVDDLEARSRRNNLRIRGFPEKCEEGNAVSFLEEVLPEILGTDFPRGLVIERAHRTLAPHVKDSPPRAIIAKFLNFRDVSHIQSVAREKGQLTWNDNNINIFPDYTKRVEKKRKKFKDCKQKLKDRNIHYVLAYPATLKIFKGDKVDRHFVDAGKAMEFINQM